MYNIRAHSIGKAHELILQSILKHGKLVFTEDSEKTIELPEPSNIHIDNPFADYMISPHNRFGKKAMEKYVTDLLNGTDSNFAYTYHDRLFDYPVEKCMTLGGDNNGEPVIVGNGDGKGINQIQTSIVERLKEEPLSRRAEGITWFPKIDIESNVPPCLQRIQCLNREGKLNMHVEFRSNDMLSALGANMYALVHLQKMIADEIGIDIGWYSHTSVSAHIYYERDHEELMKYVNGLKYNKIYGESAIFG